MGKGCEGWAVVRLCVGIELGSTIGFPLVVSPQSARRFYQSWVLNDGNVTVAAIAVVVQPASWLSRGLAGRCNPVTIRFSDTPFQTESLCYRDRLTIRSACATLIVRGLALRPASAGVFLYTLPESGKTAPRISGGHPEEEETSPRTVSMPRTSGGFMKGRRRRVGLYFLLAPSPVSRRKVGASKVRLADGHSVPGRHVVVAVGSLPGRVHHQLVAPGFRPAFVAEWYGLTRFGVRGQQPPARRLPATHSLSDSLRASIVMRSPCHG